MELNKNDIEFIKYILEFYKGEGISAKEARNSTDLYRKLFPNLWGDGDSIDREYVYQLILMARADAFRAKKRKLAAI